MSWRSRCRLQFQRGSVAALPGVPGALWLVWLFAVPLTQASTCHPAVGPQDPVPAGVGGDPGPDGEEKGKHRAICPLTMWVAPGGGGQDWGFWGPNRFFFRAQGNCARMA